jgi:hypothetical protein
VQHGEDMVLGATAQVDDEQHREVKATPSCRRIVAKASESETVRENGLGYDLDTWAVTDKDDSVHVGGGKVEHDAVRWQQVASGTR